MVIMMSKKKMEEGLGFEEEEPLILTESCMGGQWPSKLQMK
jgi:hypothetical protein